MGTIVYTDWKKNYPLYILISATVCCSYDPCSSLVVFHPQLFSANNRGVGRGGCMDSGPFSCVGHCSGSDLLAKHI